MDCGQSSNQTSRNDGDALTVWALLLRQMSSKTMNRRASQKMVPGPRAGGFGAGGTWQLDTEVWTCSCSSRYKHGLHQIRPFELEHALTWKAPSDSISSRAAGSLGTVWTKRNLGRVKVLEGCGSGRRILARDVGPSTNLSYLRPTRPSS